MRAVVQRVSEARVLISGTEHARIGLGLLVLVGVERDDTEQDAEFLGRKVIALRIFEDDRGHMNRSVQEVGGRVLAVSQFTLLGDSRRGRRPSFARAAVPERAEALYEAFVRVLERTGVETSTGVFGAMMDVELTNHGPVTLLMDSRKTF